MHTTTCILVTCIRVWLRALLPMHSMRNKKLLNHTIPFKTHYFTKFWKIISTNLKFCCNKCHAFVVPFRFYKIWQYFTIFVKNCYISNFLHNFYFTKIAQPTVIANHKPHFYTIARSLKSVRTAVVTENRNKLFLIFSSFLQEPEGKEKVKDKEKVKVMELIAKELANPERDCKKFDPGNELKS